MNVVVGLGNPGKRYEGTPHNAGFMVIEGLAGALGCRMRRSLRFHARIGEAQVGGRRIWLVMPLTYMNNSGAAVRALIRRRGMEPDGLFVVLDDADLPLGRMRIRPSGSSGGHRGLQSIIESVGSDRFPRLRVGIGRSERAESLVDHVLSPLSAGERKRMEQVVEQAGRAVLHVMEAGVDSAMNAFNGMTIGND